MIPVEFTEGAGEKNPKWGIAKVTHFIEWFQKEIPSVEELMLYVTEVGTQCCGGN